MPEDTGQLSQMHRTRDFEFACISRSHINPRLLFLGYYSEVSIIIATELQLLVTNRFDKCVDCGRLNE